jgi:hypothetical protein
MENNRTDMDMIVHGRSRITASGVGMEFSGAPEKRQTTTNLHRRGDGSNVGARPD